MPTEPQAHRQEARQPPPRQYRPPRRRIPQQPSPASVHHRKVTAGVAPRMRGQSCSHPDSWRRSASCAPDARGRVEERKGACDSDETLPRASGAQHLGQYRGQRQGHNLRSATFQPCTQNRHIVPRTNDSKGSPHASRVSAGTLHLHLSAR